MKRPRPGHYSTRTSGRVREVWATAPKGHGVEGRVGRRGFLRAVGCATVALIPTGGAAWSLIEPHRIRLAQYRLDVPALPGAFDGLRIAHLTDVHHGPYVALDHVEKAVELANAQRPDLVVLTGDYCHRSWRFIEPSHQVLGGLSAPLGRFGVLGNHDHWASASRSHRAMAAAGTAELTNTNHCLEHKGDRLWLCGVGDLWADQQVLPQALKGVPQDGCAVLLSHNPDYNEHINDPRVRLVLAGHTHGGQVNLPLIGAPILPSSYGNRYRAGIIHAGGRLVFVSPGIGVISPPVRFNCPPEVSLLTLHRA
jgi:predicted MPP superfamily phosphohydrolase